MITLLQLSAFVAVISARKTAALTFDILYCSFGAGPFYSIVGNPYQCKVQASTIIDSDSIAIGGVNGIHVDVSTNEATTMLWVRGTTFHYIPARIGHFFENLEALWIHHGGLRELRFEKMRQFPKLRYLYAGHNQLEALAPDVFRGNPLMEWIDLQSNRLRFIDGDIFVVFRLMQNLNLRRNYCVNDHHHGKVGHVHFEKIKHEIDQHCHLPNEIFCSSYVMSHLGAKFYSCHAKGTAINGKNVTLHRVLHNENVSVVARPLNETKALYIRYQNFTHFPSNLHEFLPNLEAIQIIGCKLRELNRWDVESYGELRFLWLPLNLVEALADDVFRGNSKLEKLSLYGNRLKHVGADVLTDLKALQFVSFEKNECLHSAAEGEEIAGTIRSEIDANCK